MFVGRKECGIAFAYLKRGDVSDFCLKDNIIEDGEKNQEHFTGGKRGLKNE